MPENLLDPKALETFRDLQGPDDPHFVRNFLTTVLAEIPPRLAAISQAIDQAKPITLASEAHALKSTCANTEIPLMTHLCAELEALAKAGKVDGALNLYHQLVELNNRLRIEIFALPEFQGQI